MIPSIAPSQKEPMRQEVEFDVERKIFIWNGGNGKPLRRDIKSDVPPVINQRNKSHTGFSDDLSPHVKRVTSAFPLRKCQRRPLLRVQVEAQNVLPFRFLWFALTTPFYC